MRKFITNMVWEPTPNFIISMIWQNRLALIYVVAFHFFMHSLDVTPPLASTNTAKWLCGMLGCHTLLVFQQLSCEPIEVSSSQLEAIENYVKYIYYGKIDQESVDILRMKHYQYIPGKNLRMIPPSRDRLHQHVKRSCVQGGFEWKAAVHNIVLDDVTNWGWREKDGRYVPEWLSLNNVLDVNRAVEVCSCKKALFKNCTCAKF